jgi:hypothetical protein
MAAPNKLKAESPLSLTAIVDARERQGETGQVIDDENAHVITGPWVAKNQREQAIHRIWVADPGDADIEGIDTPKSESKPDIREKFRREKKARKPKPARPKDARPKDARMLDGEDEDGKPLKPTPSKKPTTGKVGYMIIGGTKLDRKILDDTIRQNFSKSELAKTKNLVIEVAKGRGAGGGGAAGIYMDAAAGVWKGKFKPSAQARKLNPDLQHYMKIGRQYVVGDVITHEMVHHIRAQRMRDDAPKNDLTRRVDKRLFMDHDREESSTDLESISRHNPYENPDQPGVITRPSPAGYYQFIVEGSTRRKPSYDFAAIDKAELQDRAIITLGPNRSTAIAAADSKDKKLLTSGKRGNDLRKRLNTRYSQTNMGKSKMGKSTIADGVGGKAENLDQYFATVDNSGKKISRLHIRSIKMKNKDSLAVNLLGSGKAKTAKIVKYDDGKPTTLKGFTKTKTKNKFT